MAAAADLLGLALTMPGGAERLAPDLRFFYLVAENAGQTELLAGAIRRHLPGEAGRRRARAYLRREVAELVPRLIGRARADLQYRLAEATRQLARATAARYAEGTGRLENALRGPPSAGRPRPGRPRSRTANWPPASRPSTASARYWTPPPRRRSSTSRSTSSARAWVQVSTQIRKTGDGLRRLSRPGPGRGL